MTERRTIILQGPFTDDELVELGQLLRRIDERGPDRHFHMMMPQAEGTVDTMHAIMQRVFPERPDRNTEIQVFHMDRPSASGGMPGYWMHETTGELRPAVEAYMFGHHLTAAHIGALRVYFRQWCLAFPQTEGLAELVQRIDTLVDRSTITSWLDDALNDEGIDPF